MDRKVESFFSLFFGHMGQHAGPQFLKQGLNPSHGRENLGS